MIQLLRADFYKLFKMKSFWICLGISLALAVGGVFLLEFNNAMLKEMAEQTTEFAGQVMPSYNPNLSASSTMFSFFDMTAMLLSTIVISIFIASEFGFGTIKNTASKSFSRAKIFSSKLAISFLVSTVFLVLYFVVSTGTATALWGFGETASGFWPEMIKIIAIQLLLNLSFTALFVTVSFLSRVTGAAIAINICLMQFANLLVNLLQMLIREVSGQTVKVADYLISSNISALRGGELTGELATRSVLVGVVYLVVLSAIGYITFQKRDIK